MTIDSFDRSILDALQNNGRLTNAELAEKVGLSASQCSRRRQSLEEAGIISDYVALLSAQSVGVHLTVFVEVSLHAHSEERSQKFAQLIGSMPEIQEAYALTGEVDYLLKLSVTDLSKLQFILSSRLLAHDSVAKIHSSIVLEKLKCTTSLSLDHHR